MSQIRRPERLARRADRNPGDRGFMMVAILIGLGVAAIMMSAALPKWGHQVQRTREEDLIFRGEQYARAIVLYSIKNRGAYPPDIDTLISGKYLRKKWKDPVTNSDFVPVGVGIVALPTQGQQSPVGGFTPVVAGRGGNQPNTNAGTSGNGQPGVSGVRSKSTATSIKVYQQQQQYNLWAFDATFAAQKMNINLNQLGGNQGQQGGRQGGAQGGLPGAGGPGGGGPGRGGGPGDAGRGATGPGRGGPGGAAPPPPTTGRGRG